jgi:hypothetical protein
MLTVHQKGEAAGSFGEAAEISLDGCLGMGSSVHSENAINNVTQIRCNFEEASQSLPTDDGTSRLDGDISRHGDHGSRDSITLYSRSRKVVTLDF